MFGTSHLLIYDVSSIETDFTVFIKERKRENCKKEWLYETTNGIKIKRDNTE